jgi:hypothetical protein
MDAREFETIKNKVSILKEKFTKAQGALETLRETNLKDFGTNDVADMHKMVKDNDTVILQVEAKIDSLYEELKGLTNWNLL